jgi:hypothetical protein
MAKRTWDFRLAKGQEFQFRFILEPLSQGRTFTAAGSGRRLYLVLKFGCGASKFCIVLSRACNANLLKLRKYVPEPGCANFPPPARHAQEQMIRN